MSAASSTVPASLSALAERIVDMQNLGISTVIVVVVLLLLILVPLIIAF